MTRRGFALITVLWVLTALSLTVADVLVLARTGMRISANRTQQRRAAWAREACEAMLRARFAADSLTRSVARVDLGGDVWCTATLTDLGAVGHVPEPRVGGAADATPNDGSESLTIRTGSAHRVNVNAASDSVLAERLGIDLASAHALVVRRRGVGPFRAVETVVSALPPLTAQRVMTNYSGFARLIVLGADEFVAQIEGGVGSRAPTANAMLQMVPAGARLVVTQRDEW